MKAAVVIRADGSHMLGHGHVFRTLTLASELSSRGWSVAYVCLELDGAPHDRIQAAGYELVCLDASLDINADALHTAHVAERLGASWIVVDRYDTHEDAHAIWRESGVKILAIDDICEHAFSVDILLNQNTDAHDLPYFTQEHTLRLLGPKYALIGDEYRRARPVSPRAVTDIRHILVCMGGSDPLDATSAMLRLLDSTSRSLEIDMIVGAAYRPIEELRRVAKASAKKVQVYRDLSNLVEPMQRADVAITAGGSITWELCCMGLPILVSPIAVNQAGIVESMTQLGGAVRISASDAGPTGAETAQLDSLLQDVPRLAKLGETAYHFVDGKGAARVAAAMEARS